MPDSSPQSLYNRTVATNLEILREAEGIDAEWPTVDSCIDDLPNSLHYDVIAFRAALKQHFDAEEQSGYLADALMLAPHLRSRADALRAEHAALLQTTDLVLQSLEAANPDGFVKQRALFRQLVARIRQHEQSENALVLEAYEEELGAGD